MDQLNEVVKHILYRCRENNTPITQVMANFVAQTIFNNRTLSLTKAQTNFIWKINYQSQNSENSKKQQ